MLDAFFPPSATRIVIYLKPVSMRWGETKLRAFCRDELGLEPDPFTAFLFTNKARDCLLLYSADSTGDQVLIKKLEKGAFLLPAAPPDGAPFVTMTYKMLPRLFRS